MYQEKRSTPSNKLIVDVFHKLKIMESWGSGFQKIIELSLANGNKVPEFSEVAGAFVITFSKREAAIRVGEGLKGGVNEGINEHPGLRAINFFC